MKDSTRLDVFPVAEVDGFKSYTFEGLLFINSSKVSSVDTDSVKPLVARFLSQFHTNMVVCFESHVNSEGVIIWEPFSSYHRSQH